MANNGNIYSLQLLRNTSKLYADRATALAALTGSTVPDGAQDGTPVLARYKGTDNKIYTLVGFYAKHESISGDVSGDTHMTVFDYEGNEAKINEIIAKINSLDAPTVADENKIITDVTQEDGKITATASNITSVKLSGYTVGGDDSGKIASGDTLGQALGKLQGQINGMDLAVVSGEGNVITAVSEADGKVSASKTPIKDVKLTGYEKTTADTAIKPTDDIEDALSKLENRIIASQSATTLSAADKSVTVVTGTTGTTVAVNIKSGEKVIKLDNPQEGNGGIYTDIKLSGVTVSDTNVKEAWGLFSGQEQLGSTIKIYKDSSLYSVYLGHVDDHITSPTDPTVVPGTGSEALCFIYLKTDGTYELVAINVEAFLQESEFKDGLVVSNHEVKVSADTASEKIITSYKPDGTSETTADVLTVSATGVKVSNIQAAINAKVGTLDATVTGGTTAGTASSGHIQVIVAEDDGKLTGVTVTEANIANASDLDALSGKTVTAVEMTGGTAATANTEDGTKKITINTDGSQIFATGYAKGTDASAIAAADTINAALSKLENQVDKAKAAATTEVIEGTDVGDNLSIASATAPNGHVIYTVNLSDVASASALTDEIAARKAVDGQNGQTYVANAGARYIATATSLTNADDLLDAALKSLSDKTVNEVQVNGQTLAESGNAVNIVIAASATPAAGQNGIYVATDTNNGNVTLSLGTIDAGTY